MRVAEVVVSARSGFVPDDQPAFEAWIGRPFAHGNEDFTLACQLPVKPA